MHENIDVDDRSVQIARSIVSRGVLKNGVRQWQGEGFVCEEDSAGTVDSVHVRHRRIEMIDAARIGRIGCHRAIFERKNIAVSQRNGLIRISLGNL